MSYRTIVTILSVLLLAPMLSASGPVGLYGIVEKVVFEPAESAPERVQVWGAFAYVDGGASGRGLGVSKAARGYLYFKLPRPDARGATPQDAVNARREWSDLKAVSGTGQAIGFGSWGYIGAFEGLDPSASRNNPPYILQPGPAGGVNAEHADLRVRPASEPPASPAAYETDAGIVKITENGHAAIIKQLRDALRK
jgi:hypothetical protein